MDVIQNDADSGKPPLPDSPAPAGPSAESQYCRLSEIFFLTLSKTKREKPRRNCPVSLENTAVFSHQIADLFNSHKTAGHEGSRSLDEWLLPTE